MLLRTTHRFSIHGTTNIHSPPSQAPSPTFRAAHGALGKDHRAGSNDHRMAPYDFRPPRLLDHSLGGKGGEVPPISPKTTCPRSPLSRFVPTRRPGPRPSGR